MEESINNNLPEYIKRHLESVLKSSGMPDTQDSYDKISKIWVEKKEMFEAQTKNLDMIEVESFEIEDKRAILMLTFSGSLVSLGPLSNDKRWLEYASIKLRNDVPDIVQTEKVIIDENIINNRGIIFKEGPIKNTSAVFKITTFNEDVPIDEQEKRIREATIFLTNGFIKINRSITSPDVNIPDQFNLNSIVSYIASKNGLTKKLTKQIIEDYLLILESGMLLKEKVKVGKLGQLQLKIRPAQKARVGINPATGEQITIKAKPEVYVPKMSFSKYIKEKSSNLEV
jgi:nucleoid DNA-binding protein